MAGPLVDRKYNLQNLKEITTLLFSAGIDFFIFYGTLLGYRREQNVISYDNDVDIMIDLKDREKLIELGQKMNGFHLSLECPHFLQIAKPKGSSFAVVDFYLYENDPNKSYIEDRYMSMIMRAGFNHRWSGQTERNPNLACPPIRIPKKIIFPLAAGVMQDITVKTPSDVDACCRFIYGDSYMTPSGGKDDWLSERWPELRN